MNILVGLHSYNINGILKSSLAFVRYIRFHYPTAYIVINSPDNVNAGRNLFYECADEVLTNSSSESLQVFLNSKQINLDIVIRESFFSPDLQYIADQNSARYFIRNHDWLPHDERTKDWFTLHLSANEYFAMNENRNVIFVGNKVKKYYDPLIKKFRINSFVSTPAIITEGLSLAKSDNLKEGFRILQLGTVYKRKGALETLEAFNLFQNRTNAQDISLIFIGARNANERESSYIELLKENIKRMKLGDKVFVIDTHPDPFSLISDFDVLTLHSSSECTPLVIYESLFFGRPVVSSDVGAISEQIVIGEDGFLFEFGDIKTQSEHFENLYRNREVWRNQKRELIRERFFKKYNPDFINKQLGDIVGV